MARKKMYHYVMVMRDGRPRLVTKIDHIKRVAEWTSNTAPLEMSLEQAKDLVFGLCINFTFALVVTSLVPLEEQFNNDDED